MSTLKAFLKCFSVAVVNSVTIKADDPLQL